MSKTVDTIAFVDLDDTLFSTLRHHRDSSDLTPAATLVDGSVICYANPAQRLLFRMLNSHANIVPVTARNVAAFRRVLLHFKGTAICSHGATIIQGNGVIDSGWEQSVRPHLEASQAKLTHFVSLARKALDSQGKPFRSWLVCDGGYPNYAAVKDSRNDHAALHEFANSDAADWLREFPGFKLHLNGRNMALLPPGISKASAVQYVIGKMRKSGTERVIVGAGDSNTDHEFLDLCDFLIIPAKSQLASTLRDAAAK